MIEFDKKTLAELIEQTTYLEIAGANSISSHIKRGEIVEVGTNPSNLEKSGEKTPYVYKKSQETVYNSSY